MKFCSASCPTVAVLQDAVRSAGRSGSELDPRLRAERLRGAWRDGATKRWTRSPSSSSRAQRGAQRDPPLDSVKDCEKRLLEHSGALCHKDHEALRDALGLMARSSRRSRRTSARSCGSPRPRRRGGGDLSGPRAGGRGASLRRGACRCPARRAEARARPRSSRIGAPARSRCGPAAKERSPARASENNDRLPWRALQCFPHGDNEPAVRGDRCRDFADRVLCNDVTRRGSSAAPEPNQDLRASYATELVYPKCELRSPFSEGGACGRAAARASTSTTTMSSPRSAYARRRVRERRSTYRSSRSCCGSHDASARRASASSRLHAADPPPQPTGRSDENARLYLKDDSTSPPEPLLQGPRRRHRGRAPAGARPQGDQVRLDRRRRYRHHSTGREAGPGVRLYPSAWRAPRPTLPALSTKVY